MAEQSSKETIDKHGCIRWTNKKGQYHRMYGPALSWGGNHFWYQNGQLHNDHGPAEIDNMGQQFWYKRGKLHRTDGPAALWFYGVGYYQNGQLHREDGPAVIYHDGRKEYWIKGKPLTISEFKQLKRKKNK